MSTSKRYNYAETRQRVERAHRQSGADGLGDIHINMLVKHNAWLIAEWMNQRLESQGLSYSSYVALVSLYSMPERLANPSDLCLCTGETRANMTRICDELVEQGLVDRITNVEDRRRVDLSLTAKGEGLLKTVMPDLRGGLHDVLEIFSAEEKVTLESLLLKLMKVFQPPV